MTSIWQTVPQNPDTIDTGPHQSYQTLETSYIFLDMIKLPVLWIVLLYNIIFNFFALYYKGIIITMGFSDTSHKIVWTRFFVNEAILKILTNICLDPKDSDNISRMEILIAYFQMGFWQHSSKLWAFWQHTSRCFKSNG